MKKILGVDVKSVWKVEKRSVMTIWGWKEIETCITPQAQSENHQTSYILLSISSI